MGAPRHAPRSSPTPSCDDVAGLLAAIRDFHRLRSSQLRDERTSHEDANRLRDLRDVLEPRRASSGTRTRFELSVDERATVMVDGCSWPARLKRLGLRRVALETHSPLMPGARMLLSVATLPLICHFHARVLRTFPNGSVTAEILAASLDE